jgi:hypothetical protein
MADNIWKSLNFSEIKQESAYDLLLPQAKDLLAATSGELKMEIDAIDAYLEEQPQKFVALYMLYVVAPNLGNFRRKILTIIEGKEIGKFPVEIFCHVDEIKNEKVEKDIFLDKISEILGRPLVKSTIENLYQESKVYSKLD